MSRSGDANDAIRLLSIDGGGVRGLIVLQCLAKLERELGFRTPDIFNAYSGTSIGSIIVCFFAYLNMSAIEVMDYFIQNRLLEKYLPKSIFDYIFGVLQFRPKYSDSQRFEVLTNVFKDITISQTKSRVLLTGYDLIRNKTIYFTSQNNLNLDIKVVDAIIISSSAPIYFSCFRVDNFYKQHQKEIFENILIRSRNSDNNDSDHSPDLYGVDGGIASNNPSDIAVLELLVSKPSEITVVSMGTGYVKTKVNLDNVSNWGFLKWLITGELLQKLANGSGDIAEERCRKILNIYSNVFEIGETTYLRINGEIDTSTDQIDNTKSSNLKKLRDYGDHWAINNLSNFKGACHVRSSTTPTFL